MLERDVAEAAIDRSNEAIIDIFNALVRLDAGSYGLRAVRYTDPIRAARGDPAGSAVLLVSRSSHGGAPPRAFATSRRAGRAVSPVARPAPCPSSYSIRIAP
jgi:hypothetical protein